MNGGSRQPTYLHVVLAPDLVSHWRTNLHSPGCYSSPGHKMQSLGLNQCLGILDSIQITLALHAPSLPQPKDKGEEKQVLDCQFLKSHVSSAEYERKCHAPYFRSPHYSFSADTPPQGVIQSRPDPNQTPCSCKPLQASLIGEDCKGDL